MGSNRNFRRSPAHIDYLKSGVKYAHVVLYDYITMEKDINNMLPFSAC